MKNIVFGFALVFCVCAARGGDKPTDQKPLVVHEWGTFTSLQDEQGNAIGGINTDDEALPFFVGELDPQLHFPPTEAPVFLVKAAPECDPDVTMRLETPVLYFYPPAGWKSQSVDVHVQFHGGWLTEFYPDADVEAPGYNAHPDKTWPGELIIGHITSDTVGKLTWRGLTLGGKPRFNYTEEKVWLAPRAVKSAVVSTPDGGSEQFLFYRGLGHLDAPVKVVRNAAAGTLKVCDGNTTESGTPWTPLDDLFINAAWLVDVKADGTCAFKALGALDKAWKIDETMPASFRTGDYTPGTMASLRGQMRAALIKQGLFADEADALLNTWEVSYFKSPGLRFFYLCPRVVTDAILPLNISVAAKVTRVMIGRIEIVTPEQRDLLAKIAAGPAPDLRIGIPKYLTSDFIHHPEIVKTWNAVMDGKAPYSALGFPVPELYADYLKLGRFRNALILDRQKRTTTPAMAQFIANCGLRTSLFAPTKIDPQKTAAQAMNSQK